VPGASVSASTAAFSASLHFRRRSTRVMTSTLSIAPPSGLQKDSPGRADFREHHQQRNAAEAGRLQLVCERRQSCRRARPASIECSSLPRKLAKGLPFVRVDFYAVNGEPKLREVTFSRTMA
jgi:hypothetical protein